MQIQKKILKDSYSATAERRSREERETQEKTCPNCKVVTKNARIVRIKQYGLFFLKSKDIRTYSCHDCNTVWQVTD